MKKPVMYLIANKGLKMSPGKLAAQVAHAAVRAAMESSLDGRDNWFKNGETKIVLQARDTEHLLLSQRYIEGHGIITHLVIDEGRTEVPPLSATVLGVELVDKSDENIQMVFETFSTYKEDKELIPVPILYPDESFGDEGILRRLRNRS